MSFPFGATVSQRGSLKSVAKTLILNPAGTVGRKPFGGFDSSGGFPADFVANGAGSCGACPCVTCPSKIPGAAHKIPNAAMRNPHRLSVASIKISSEKFLNRRQIRNQNHHENSATVLPLSGRLPLLGCPDNSFGSYSRPLISDDPSSRPYALRSNWNALNRAPFLSSPQLIPFSPQIPPVYIRRRCLAFTVVSGSNPGQRPLSAVLSSEVS